MSAEKSPDKVEFGKRVQLIRKFYRLSREEMAAQIGYENERTYGPIETGNRILPTEKLLKLKQLYPDLDANWILTGKGDMHLSTTSEQTKSASKEELDEQKKRIDEMFERLLKIESVKEAYEEVLKKMNEKG